MNFCEKMHKITETIRLFSEKLMVYNETTCYNTCMYKKNNRKSIL